jgi:hypothetical protein
MGVARCLKPNTTGGVFAARARSSSRFSSAATKSIGLVYLSHELSHIHNVALLVFMELSDLEPERCILVSAWISNGHAKKFDLFLTCLGVE